MSDKTLGMFDALDVYDGVVEDVERIDTLATISAGFKDGNGNPVVSRDGSIMVSDPENRAPGLKAMLEANGRKFLDIAFPYDDPRKFITQRFTEYSKTRLLKFGDERAITVIDDKGNRTEHPAGSDGYTKALQSCKVSVSVLFVLLEWSDERHHIVFPDGMGLYRLRFTSRNSLQNLLGKLKLIHRHTGGRLTFVPFRLQLTYPSVMTPKTGVRQRVPVWTFTPQVPEGVKLSLPTYREMLLASMTQAEILALPAPVDEDAALQTPEPDLDEIVVEEHDLKRLLSEMDYNKEINRYFAVVEGSPLAEDEARHAWLEQKLGEGSLREILVGVGRDAWETFLVETERRVAELRLVMELRAFAEYPEAFTGKHVEFIAEIADRLLLQGLRAPHVYPFFGWLFERDEQAITSPADFREAHLDKFKQFFTVARGSKLERASDEHLRRLVESFYTSDDDEAAALLAP